MTSTQLDGNPSLSVPTGLPTTPDSLAVIQFLQQQELEKKKQAWAAHFEAEYTKCKNARIGYERQWYVNLAFNAGRQYVTPIESPIGGTRLTVPRVPPHRVRLVINLIRKAVIKECSKLSMSKPIPTVMPATNEAEDLTAAQVAEAILKAKFADSRFEDEYRLWIWWGVLCGNSYLKSYYDPREVDYENMELPDRSQFQYPPGSGNPIPDEIIERLPELKQYLETPQPGKGKICIEHMSPFHMYVPNLMATNLESQAYVIEVRTKHPEWVKKTYGFTPNVDSRAEQSIMDNAFLSFRHADEHLDAVIVKEVWIKPNYHPDFPKGGKLTIINGGVRDFNEEWPLPFPEYPYYKYNGMPTGQFYTDSRVVDLIPIQKEYNKKRSQGVEILNTMGKPKFFAQQGSVNFRKISSEPGQGIEYKLGYNPPTIINGIEIPNSFFTELEQLRNEFNDISGQHEISDGQTPSGVSSGTAISFLQEQDDTGLVYQVSGIEHGVQLLGTHYLRYVTTYWGDERIIRVTGKNNTYESIHWKKSAAKGNTDVKVQTGSALPFSKAAKQALITEMMQNGFLSPEVGLEILDMGTFDKAMEEFLMDKRAATRENIKHQDLPDSVIQVMLTPPPDLIPQPDGSMLDQMGKPWRPQSPIPVNSWDNHEVHIQYHDMYRKSQEFEVLTEAQKQAMEMHVQTHRAALLGGMVNKDGQALDEVAMGSQQMQQDEQMQQQQQSEQFEHQRGMQQDKLQSDQQVAQARQTTSGNQ